MVQTETLILIYQLVQVHQETQSFILNIKDMVMVLHRWDIILRVALVVRPLVL